METEKIQKANRKAMPKFIALMAVSLLVGGSIGFCAAFFGFNTFAGKLAAAGAFFAGHMAHWLLLALALLVPAVCLPVYNQSRRLVQSWDGEDNAVAEKAEEKLSMVMWISGAAMILGYFLIAAAYMAGNSIFTGKDVLFGFWLSIVAFVALMVENTLLQQRSVDLTKRLYPEKQRPFTIPISGKSGWTAVMRRKKS